jgi:hypothetical protein
MMGGEWVVYVNRIQSSDVARALRPLRLRRQSMDGGEVARKLGSKRGSVVDAGETTAIGEEHSSLPRAADADATTGLLDTLHEHRAGEALGAVPPPEDPSGGDADAGGDLADGDNGCEAAVAPEPAGPGPSGPLAVGSRAGDDSSSAVTLWPMITTGTAARRGAGAAACRRPTRSRAPRRAAGSDPHRYRPRQRKRQAGPHGSAGRSHGHSTGRGLPTADSRRRGHPNIGFGFGFGSGGGMPPAGSGWPRVAVREGDHQQTSAEQAGGQHGC